MLKHGSAATEAIEDLYTRARGFFVLHNTRNSLRQSLRCADHSLHNRRVEADGAPGPSEGFSSVWGSFVTN